MELSRSLSRELTLGFVVRERFEFCQQRLQFVVFSTGRMALANCFGKTCDGRCFKQSPQRQLAIERAADAGNYLRCQK